MAYGSPLQRLVYRHAPPSIKNAITSVYGLKQRSDRYGDHYRAALSELRESERLPVDVLLDRQFEKLRAFLLRAERDSPYHRARFERAGFSAEGMRSIDDLACIPLLSKEDARLHAAEITSRSIRDLNVRWLHTSGTTGKALSIPMSAYSYQREYAFRASHYDWGGVSLDARERLAFLFGHPVTPPDRTEPPFWSYDHANRWLLMSSYHLSERNLGHYVRELERYRPVMIAGYPSSLYLLARAYAQHGSGKLRLKAIFAASETLLYHQRATIEESFGVRVLVWYGNTEMCGNIVECAAGSMHERLEHSYLEVLDYAGRPAREGRLVCTGFGNDAFPLIRYEIGDRVARVEQETCACGRPGRFFERILGRNEDYVVTPDGRFVGRLDHLFKDAVNVREAQLVQNEPSSLTIRIVRRPGYGAADEQSILSEARVRLGSAITLRFEYVPEIPRTSAGKFRFILSSLERGRVGYGPE